MATDQTLEQLPNQFAKLGRLGGLVMLVFAAVMLWGGWFLFGEAGPMNGAEYWSPEATFVAGFMMLGGVALVVQALALLLAKPRQKVAMTNEALLAALTSGTRPMAVCFDCRTMLQVPPCEHCHQKSSCLEIETPTDVENAKALLGL